MGTKKIQIKIKPDYSTEELRRVIERIIATNNFSFQLTKKSLDARNKQNIHCILNLVVSSPVIKTEEFSPPETLDIPYKKRSQHVVVVGSGPAGFFAARVLQQAGYQVTIVERGSEVDSRARAIGLLENEGKFSEQNNYAFGEGGAGTFSDGKLTSRSKHISKERAFVLSEYVKAGAPEEILYMTHPHLGTDNLRNIVANMRQTFLNKGGTFLFDTIVIDLDVKGNKVCGVVTSTGELEADKVILATGHSAYDTYRMLIRKGVGFKTKNFALGHRIEHSQELINQAQWGKRSLPGVKAAEYRLSTKSASGLGVYTFCMCPGGQVVPAAAFPERGVVNGMSYYTRSGEFANSGCVAGVHPDMLLGYSCSPVEILDWMDNLEERFFKYTGSYVAPALGALDYLQATEANNLGKTSYSLGLQTAPLFNMLPSFVSEAIRDGLKDFSRKLPGFNTGILMGLESKTSSPLQVLRSKEGKCEGFENLFFVGEGSGFAGGIVSSAADGIRCSMHICS